MVDPLTAGVFTWGMFTALEKVIDRAVESTWDPAHQGAKGVVLRLAGKDKAGQRRAAFDKAAKLARDMTLRQSPAPQEAERILALLDASRNKRVANVLAEEGAKVMLFSATPDLPRVTEICRRELAHTALVTKARQPAPTADAIAGILTDYLTNLREALLDQEAYHELVESDMRRILKEILGIMRQEYDSEATYRSQMAARYRELDFVGIPELKERWPITIEDIFIRLRGEAAAQDEGERRLLESYELAERRGDLETLERLRAERNRLAHVAMPSKTVMIDEALRETKRMVILGDPGTGKTTMLKYLTVICAEGRAVEELGLQGSDGRCPLPIFLSLREFAAEAARRQSDYTILDGIYTHAHEHLLLHLEPGFFEAALAAGCALVCLDGLDEVWSAAERKMFCDAVKALAARYPQSRYVVTSRVVGYEDAPLDRSEFSHHTVLPLSDEDIWAFVEKWYCQREHDPIERAQKIKSLIETIEREPHIQTLARNPLLLTIIALVHRIEADLPHERVKLYDKCVTALVDTWDEVKGLTIADRRRPAYRYRRRLLEQLAYALHTRAERPGEVQTIREGDLELLVAGFLVANPRLEFDKDPDGAREEGRAFIRLARGRTGMLVERGAGVFAFPHLTFEEYLTACDIEKRCTPDGEKALWSEIKDRLHDPHWREVILLLLGSLSQYEDLPSELVGCILKAGTRDKFERVLHRHLYLAARVLGDRVDVTSALRRQIAEALVRIVRDAPFWEREDAIAVLPRLSGNAFLEDGLLALARDAQLGAAVRSKAASALGQLGRVEQATEVLLALAQDAQLAANVRSEAARSLGQLGRAEEAAEVLLALAQDTDVDASVRSASASALGELGRAGVATDLLLPLARDVNADIAGRFIAAIMLGELRRAEDEVLHDLLALAQDAQVDILVRFAAATEVGQLGWRDDNTLDGLLALAQDAQVDEFVRFAAVNALSWLGGKESRVLDGLLALARDTQVSDFVRSGVASALGQLGGAEDKVLDGLLALTRDALVSAYVRCMAARSLGQLGRAEQATEVLLALARDAQLGAAVRSKAASALGQLGRVEQATEVLLALAQDAQLAANVRSEAARSLGQLGRAEEAAEVLLALAQDTDVDASVRSASASALGELGRAGEKILDGLLALARNAHLVAPVRSAAYSALKAIVAAD